MATKRDQLQSYQFHIQRVVSALVIEDTDPAQSPFRRGVAATFAGLMIAVIVVAGVTVYGLLVQGGKKSWKDPAAIVLEKETGARYVFRDGVLHPVANYTSALLLGSSVAVPTARASLAGIPRGVTLGIPGLPDSVPATRDLYKGAWTMCVRPDPAASGTARSGSSILTVGPLDEPGRELRDEGALVQVPGGNTYLVWHGHRFEITDTAVVLKALTWEDDKRMAVDQAWLNTLPAGGPLGRVQHADIGKPTAFPAAGTTGGLVFFVKSGSSTQFYVALTDGLAKITPLQADILRGDPKANPAGTAPVEIQASTVKASATDLTPGTGDAQPPATAPAMAPGVSDQTTVCARFSDGGGSPTLTVDARTPATGSVPPTPGATEQGGALADWVVVSPGRAVLVRAVSSPGAGDGMLMLVSEPGIAYPVPNQDALKALGYDARTAVRLPTELLRRVPTGPALDPVAAKLPANA